MTCLSDRNKQLGDVMDLPSSKRLDGYTVKCSADIDTDLGDAVDVRMSHTFSLTFSLSLQQHTHDM